MQREEPHFLSEKTEATQSSVLSIEDVASSSIRQTDEPAPRKFMWWIPLHNHVHPMQFFAFIFTVFMALALIVYIAGTQGQIILGVLGIAGNTGDITGSLALYAEIIALFGVIMWSMASDRIGRRGVMCISTFLMGMVITCYPHITNVYPQMLILKLIFSVGSAGSTSMMVAIMMEVAHGKGGLVSGCIGIASGLGATFAALCLFMVPAFFSMQHRGTNLGITYAHAAIGSSAMGASILLFFCMPKDSCTRPPVNHFKGYIRKLYTGISRLVKTLELPLGYASSFFARADEIIITNFLALWVAKYYIEEGKCQVGKSCLYALASSSTLSGYSQLVALGTAPFFGVASEYLPKEWAVFVAGIVGACGCIPFAFSIDPTSKLSMGFVILIATGQYGMIISGMAMVAGTHVKREDNAAVSATYSFIGAVGIIIISKLGGVLFDRWMKGAPFLLLGIGHCLICAMSFAVYVHRFIVERKQKKQLLSNQEVSNYVTESK